MTFKNLTLISSVAAAVIGCSAPVKVTAPVPQGKLVAPVAMEAELTERAAKLTLRFESEASDVKASVWGVDGLLVKGERELIVDGAFKKGDTRAFNVAFTPGAGRSHLAVAVSGTFKGSKLDRVATFAVGTPTEEQLKGPGENVTTDDGQHIKLMPAKTE